MKRVLFILLFLFGAAPAFSQSLIAHTIAGSTNLNTFTTSAIDTTGANFCVASWVGGGANTATISDSKANTPTATITQGDDFMGGLGLTPASTNKYVYYQNPTVGAGHTWTITGTGTASAVAVACFSGMNTSSVFDASNSSYGSILGTSVQPGSITTSASTNVAVTTVTFAVDGTGVAINSSFTISDSTVVTGGQHYGIAMAYKIGVSGTENPTWSGYGGDYSPAIIADFKKAAAASGDHNRLLLGVGQ